MKSFITFVFLTFSTTNIAQTIYSTGENDFTDEDEQSVVFTSYENQVSLKLKDSIDLSYMMPPPGNQGSKGSCWAWATTYVLRSTMDNPNNYINGGTLDENKVYSPEYVYQIYKGNVSNCKFGAVSYKMLDSILKKGAVKYAAFKYDESACNNQPDPTLQATAKQYIKKGYEVENIHDLISIKKVLNENQPLIIAIKVDDYFCTKGNITMINPFWRQFHTRRGSHAMVVVGYSDKLNAVKVLNSWGQDFGERGYVWIDYSIINSSMSYCCYPKKIDTENIEIKNPEEEETNESKTSNAKNGSKWPTFNKDYLSSWFKKGYYRVFDDLRIGLAAFDKRKKFAIIHIRDNDGDLLNSFYVAEFSTKDFYANGMRYKFTFDNVGQAGNIFTKALFFTVNKVPL